MTVRTPPTFLQAGSHTAENTRLLAHGLLQSTPSSFAGGVAAADPAHGVARIGDLTVSQNGTPNMSVNVASGGCFIRGTQSAAQGVYHVFNDATVNLSIDTADATNPRRDLIVMQVRDSGYAGANDDARLLVVKGTGAASPVDPTPPADCLVLARVAVAANATSIVTANITDLRTYAYGQSKMPTFASTTERDIYLPSPVEGMICYVGSNDASEGLYCHSGTSWRKGPGWNAPWGHVARAAQTSSWSTSAAGFVTIPSLTQSCALVQNRIYRIHATTIFTNTAAGAISNFAVRVGGTTIQQSQKEAFNNTNTNLHAMTTYYVATATATATIDVQVATQGTATFGAIANYGSLLLIEDIGPSGAPV